MLRKVLKKKNGRSTAYELLSLSFSDKPFLATENNFMLLHDISYGSHKLNKFEG